MPAPFLKDSGHLLPMEQLGGESDFTTLKGSRQTGTSEHRVTVKAVKAWIAVSQHSSCCASADISNWQLLG